MTPARTLLQGLLRYVHEQAKQVDLESFRLESRGFCWRRDAVAGLPGVELDRNVAGDHVWLSVQRLEAFPPPAPAVDCRAFFRISDRPDGPEPELDEVAFDHWLSTTGAELTDAERGVLESTRRESLANELQRYAELWTAWAKGEEPRRISIDLYAQLFALKQQMESEETSNPHELVCGIGLSYCILASGSSSVTFDYPLITQALEISIDERTLALDVRPRATDARLELDAFIACQVPGAADTERAGREQLAGQRQTSVSPFDPSTFAPTLRLIAGNLDAAGSYVEVVAKAESLPAHSDALVVTDEWALFSRKRSRNFLFDDLKRLSERLEDGCAIPEGPEALVSEPSDDPLDHELVRYRGLSSRGDSGGSEPKELYFPLPYNEEQITIVQRLDRAAGVAVQGPPGTGKTHTIANLICHYLATGRRVLVTTRGEPALAVLQDKIPEEVRPLTVALLTSDRHGLRQFQASIEAIQHQVSQLNLEQARGEIELAKAAIDRGHDELSRIDRRVDEIARAQLSDIDVDGAPKRAEDLAKAVVDGRAKFGWFDDAITLSEKHSPPLSQEDAARLRAARTTLAADLSYLNHRLPAADDLPSVAVIAQLHEALLRTRDLDQQVARGELLALKAGTVEVLRDGRDLIELMDVALERVQALEAIDNAWPVRVRAACHDPGLTAEREALQALLGELDTLRGERATFLQRPVEFPEEALSSPETREAVARAAATGRPFGILPFGNRESRQHVAAIRTAGLAPSSPDDWAHVLRYLEAHQRLIVFAARWNQIANVLSLPPLIGSVSNMRDIYAAATLAHEAHRLATVDDINIAAKAKRVFSEPPYAALRGSARELTAIRDQLRRHLTRSELAQSVAQLAIFSEKLADKSGPIVNQLHEFIDRRLGQPGIAVEDIGGEYRGLISELRRLADLSSALALVSEMAARVESAGASQFAERIRHQQVAEGRVDDVVRADWREAWTWARLRSHIESIDGRGELISLNRRREDIERGLARLYRQLVSKAAWLETKRNASPRVLGALAGYATAVRRIGQGTGPNATRYRRDAREAMQDAAAAVPCWIMSHARVSEAMPADIGMFDLVIVDEASQSDLWALPAILRGKKILVVGDDKQVSPDPGFVAAQRIQELKQRFLADQPYGTEMTPEKSLYDLAARVFAGSQVMLREHFRCVPPIIAYSNAVFYKGGIRPLRIPKPSERIDPPLVDVYVENGTRNRRDCNEAEAAAIAEEIDTVLRSEHLADRSIGVVSLLGLEQAKYIDAKVRERCDPAELMRRRFACGDARTFQGSERDIMFLSMVVDPTDCKAISGNLFDQRFNVAASRARDRMYLIRSVRLSDLSEKDLRQTLLAHFEKPINNDGFGDSEQLVDLCESGFERQVFLALTSLGYRVMPQVKTGAYRIDLVVEGARDARLAIECDGDEYHGPDRWAHDMARQRTLERAGWTFWRCFASTWQLRKDDVLEELREQLTAMGIEPLGAVDRAPELVEKRTFRRRSTGEGAEDPSADALERAISISGDAEPV